MLRSPASRLAGPNFPPPCSPVISCPPNRDFYFKAIFAERYVLGGLAEHAGQASSPAAARAQQGEGRAHERREPHAIMAAAVAAVALALTFLVLTAVDNVTCGVPSAPSCSGITTRR